MPGLLMDYLPCAQLSEVRNLMEFAGILVIDKWTGNSDGRQAVFARGYREKRYRAFFIDYGHCFHAGDWRFDDCPLQGAYYLNDVYCCVKGWNSFEPWLTRVETFSERVLWSIANDIPPEWYERKIGEIEALIANLLLRRSHIRELIRAFRSCDRHPFPGWDGFGNGRVDMWNPGLTFACWRSDCHLSRRTPRVTEIAEHFVNELLSIGKENVCR